MKRITALLALLVVSVALLGGCIGKKDELEGQVAAVNGDTISDKDLTNRMRIYELFFKQPITDSATRAQLLDQMIRERLILSEAIPMGVQVDQAKVEGEMARFFAALEGQYSDRAEIDAKVAQLQLTHDDIAAFLGDFLLAQAVVEKKKAAVELTDDEVRAFYEQNRETVYRFDTDVVRASHVLLPLDQEDKAKEVAAMARNSGDFAALAREYSIDPGSARQGGDLGFFTKASMVAEFADAAFAMQPGQISEPVKSQFGWHVIKVDARKGPGTLTFEEAESDVRNRLLVQKQNAEVEEWVIGLEKAATISKRPPAP